ncbi:hypothetical protein SLA2020_140020 [Shorea laevis]
MPVYCCDALHWTANRADQQPYDFILAFDLVIEDFCEVPQLDNFNETGGKEVATLGGRLCVMTSQNYDVWVMKDYMVKESWTKPFSISLPDEIWRSSRLLGYSSRGDRVLLLRGDDYLWHDPEKKQAEIVESCCSEPPEIPAICERSLVSLRAYKGTRRRGHSN